LHVPEGVIQSAPVLVTGAVLSGAGTVVGLWRVDHERMPRVGLAAAVFFVASLIHVPVGPSSVHLIMGGLAGLLLGTAAFPAILCGLLLQALFFQYGGLTVLGVNAWNMGAPAVLCGLVLRPLMGKGTVAAGLGGFLAGSISVLLAGLLTAATLVWAGEQFTASALAIIGLHLPVMIVEGLVCMFVSGYLARVKPEMLGLEVTDGG
jgi:cobalt/nickel transport system permease protein